MRAGVSVHIGLEGLGEADGAASYAKLFWASEERASNVEASMKLQMVSFPSGRRGGIWWGRKEGEQERGKAV
eukprot:CAMPEP_0196660202 /NCGR_PEP_ID=MMETSP1086-20130531/38644_1 /TAXON_ID=77921 /ORGANISM="Cyanoptyche  gloeocystis , Strain SAG4.97" /LENGTH=71 /DNA_ID=CAMNT_0041994501 /DNA_START=92 /DNA_END=304 /DNA_ORIENTATION=-